jgi:hypothetical protein
MVDHVTFSTQPSNGEWFRVIIVMGFGFWIGAYFAWHSNEHSSFYGSEHLDSDVFFETVFGLTLVLFSWFTGRPATGSAFIFDSQLHYWVFVKAGDWF